MEWLINNKEWLFSGVLISVPIALISFFAARRKKESSNKKMVQKGGKNSRNIQIGGDVEIGKDRK